MLIVKEGDLFWKMEDIGDRGYCLSHGPIHFDWSNDLTPYLSQLKYGKETVDRKQAEVVELRRQNEVLERENLTKGKEAELHAEEIKARDKEAKDKEQAVIQNYKTIFDEQELAMDAQVRPT